MTVSEPLALGSLCSGYGGLDMAVAAVLNVRPVWVADAGTASVGGIPAAPVTGAAADADRGGRRPDEHEVRAGQPDVEWGDYAPAIDRWARVLGRPAPAPTEPGRDGRPRLSPAFVEWLMGLPEGHVTAVPGLTRNQQLRALGNGVIPAQGAAALATLAERLAAYHPGKGGTAA